MTRKVYNLKELSGKEPPPKCEFVFYSKKLGCLFVRRPEEPVPTEEHYSYHIELSRCQEDWQVIDWLDHMTGKPWFGPQHTYELLRWLKYLEVVGPRQRA